MKAGLYVRVSTTEQANEGYSIGEQTERLNRYAEAMGWDVYDTYTDPGFSGGSMDRPGLQRLIRDAKARKVDKVLVYKLDRLSRSQLDTLYLIEKVFLANGVDFVSMNENFSADTPFGRAALGIMATFAQFEREQIKERMMMGKAARAKSGKFSGGNNIPYGYDYIDHELVVNEHEAEIVREVFRRYITGVPTSRIAKDLNASGISSRAGKWHDSQIRNIIDNKNSTGMVRFQGEWLQGTHEPILDAETFDAAQLIRRKRQKEALLKNARIGKASSYLSGLVYCARCGARYSKKTYHSTVNGKKYLYSRYGCVNRVRDKARRTCACDNKFWNEKDLDGLVFDEIRKLKLDPKAADHAPEPKPDIYALEMEGIDKRIKRLMDLYEAGTIDLDEISERVQTLNQKRRVLADEQEDARDRKVAEKAVQSFSEVLENGTLEQVRVLLFDLIRRIDIDGEDVSIYWNL